MDSGFRRNDAGLIAHATGAPGHCRRHGRACLGRSGGDALCVALHRRFTAVRGDLVHDRDRPGNGDRRAGGFEGVEVLELSSRRTPRSIRRGIVVRIVLAIKPHRQITRYGSLRSHAFAGTRTSATLPARSAACDGSAAPAARSMAAAVRRCPCRPRDRSARRLTNHRAC